MDLRCNFSGGDVYVIVMKKGTLLFLVIVLCAENHKSGVQVDS